MSIGADSKIRVLSGIVCFCDVDEILSSFHDAYNSYLRSHGYDIPRNYVPDKYSYAELMSEKEFVKHFNALGIDWPAKCHVFAGAAEFVRRLSTMGVRIVLLTSIHGRQLPYRLNNMKKHKIYYDEAYASKGREKSEFANELVDRYVDSAGKPVKCILVDDYSKNAVEFVKKVPSAIAAITMDVGYSKEHLEKVKNNKKIMKKIVATAKTPQEIYQSTLEVIAKFMTRRIGRKKSKK